MCRRVSSFTVFILPSTRLERGRRNSDCEVSMQGCVRISRKTHVCVIWRHIIYFWLCLQWHSCVQIQSVTIINQSDSFFFHNLSYHLSIHTHFSSTNRVTLMSIISESWWLCQLCTVLLACANMNTHLVPASTTIQHEAYYNKMDECKWSICYCFKFNLIVAPCRHLTDTPWVVKRYIWRRVPVSINPLSAGKPENQPMTVVMAIADLPLRTMPLYHPAYQITL